MSWANPDIAWLAAMLAGLVFELMLIALLNIALAVGALASNGNHAFRGAVCGLAFFVLLGAALLFWSPAARLRSYAHCVEPLSDSCMLMTNGT